MDQVLERGQDPLQSVKHFMYSQVFSQNSVSTKSLVRAWSCEKVLTLARNIQLIYFTDIFNSLLYAYL